MHPKALIDDLRHQTEQARPAQDEQLDLFSTFDELPKDADRTEFYQHDQNWANRMILGDSLQVMVSFRSEKASR